MYQLLRQSGEITSNNSIEVSELQLSGLVVKRQEKLRVYNRIYQQIFDDNWIESQLKSLRPYSENFRVWVESGGTDESRLLRGKALKEAVEWAQGKTLSYQDKQYLAASQEKEIQQKIAASEQEAALERERKDKEAAESRNQMLREANKKAQRRISIGVFVVIFAILGAAAVGLLSRKQLNETKDEVEAVKQLNKLAGELENKKSSNSDYNEALRLSALSFNIDNHSLKQAIVFAAQSQAYQQLKKLEKAKQEIEKSETNLHIAEEGKEAKEPDLLQIQVLFYKTEGSLLAQKNKNNLAIEAYTKAFNILKKHPKETDFTKDNQFITGENITSVHRGLIKLLSKNNTESDLRKQVEKSLTKHLYAQLEDYLNAKNWAEADRQTYRLMLNIAKREDEYWDYNSIKSFSCPDLQRIDKLWFNSDNRFGFRVQKEIWIRTGNRLGIEPEQWNDLDRTNYLRFAKAVGWYDDLGQENGTLRGAWVNSYYELNERINKYPGDEGSYPELGGEWVVEGRALLWWYFFSRVATCEF